MNKALPEVPLVDIAKPISRSVEVTPGKNYRTIGVKWWGEGAYERQTIDGSATAAKSLSLVRRGDLIINKIWVRHGSTAIAGADVDGCAASGEFPTFTLDESRVTPKWLHWQTKTRGFWAKCDALSQGTSGKNRIKPELFLTIRVPLPPLTEQRRVVARIEALAAQIHEARTLRHQSVEEAAVLTGNEAARIFDSLGNRRSLGDICETTSGGTPSRDRMDFYIGNIPWVKSGELKDTFIKHAEEHISEQALKTSAAKLFPSGTLVVALYGANVGKTGVLSIEASTNQAVCALFPNKELERDYVWWFLRRMRPAFLEASFGGAQPNISQKIIRETEIPVPPLAEQRLLVAELDALQAEVDALKRLQAETAAELDALIPAILDRAFKGEL
jgi:type I restriction enzyme S subunit